MTGPRAAAKVRQSSEWSRDRAGTTRRSAGKALDVSRLPLHSVGDLLAMQRSLGNQVVARTVQRRIERGSGTGWGAVGWVEGGKAIWERIDRGFNTDLFKVRSELQ